MLKVGLEGRPMRIKTSRSFSTRIPFHYSDASPGTRTARKVKKLRSADCSRLRGILTSMDDSSCSYGILPKLAALINLSKPFLLTALTLVQALWTSTLKKESSSWSTAKGAVSRKYLDVGARLLCWSKLAKIQASPRSNWTKRTQFKLIKRKNPYLDLS